MQRIRSHIWHWLISRVPPLWLKVRTRHGIFKISNRDQVIGRLLYVKREFEWDKIESTLRRLKLLGVVPSKKTLLDIGANIGLSTIGFRQLGYQNPIKLFEANPFLSRFLDDLEKKYENLEINQIALGNENTELDLYLVYYKNRCLHTFSSFSKEFVQQSLAKCYPQKLAMFEIRSQKVPMIRFDDMAEQWNPVFIKIDVEGFEYPILQGMERTIHRCRPVFLIEFNPTQFKLITDFLPKDYALYSYNHTEEKIELIDPENIHERIREGGGMSIRNIYFSAHQ